ncbi:MAG: hypothetical protein F6K31_06835 [Symploca sp. SIO2G7]|nr:hypothetical protein [Symploca sp. SIO2G7]
MLLVISCLLFVICHLSLVICHWSLVVCHLSFVIGKGLISVRILSNSLLYFDKSTIYYLPPNT